MVQGDGTRSLWVQPDPFCENGNSQFQIDVLMGDIYRL